MNNISQLIPQEDFFNYISSTERNSKKLTKNGEMGRKTYILFKCRTKLAAYQYTTVMTSLLMGMMMRYLIWMTYKGPDDWTSIETIFLPISL